MADDQNAEPSASSDQPTRREKPSRQTVQVAKEMVLMAKKVAVLRGDTLAQYSKQVLRLCADQVEDEITEKGALAVRDRAEAIDLSQVEKGNFNTDPHVATRLNMLAGSCLTSVAKLIHPYLRNIVESDFRRLGGRWTLPLDSPHRAGVDVPPSQAIGRTETLEELQAQLLHVLSNEQGHKTVLVPDDALIEYDIKKGDIITYALPDKDGYIPGDTILTMEETRPKLYTLRWPGSAKRVKRVAPLPPLIDADDDVMKHAVGYVNSIMRLFRPFSHNYPKELWEKDLNRRMKAREAKKKG